MYILLIFLISLCSKVASASVNITTTRSLRDQEEITSDNTNFILGFFSPPSSTNRYAGIWYNTGSDTLSAVWVANRDNPLKDSSGVFKLSEDGNLQVMDGQNNVLWSSNTTHASVSNASVAHLEDTGNLVLLSNGVIIWQSFEHPTDTVLPQMNTGTYDHTNKTELFLRSWKSPSDPSSGHFAFGLTPSRRPFEICIWYNGRPYWRSGPWNGIFFIGIPSTYYLGINTIFQEDDISGQPRLLFSPKGPASLPNYVLTYDGMLEQKEWNQKWNIVWSTKQSECDVYGKCGPFAKCNPQRSPICSCLEGFEPVNYKEWTNGNWTGGCARRTRLQCENMTGKEDGFKKVQNVKVPDQAERTGAADEEDCQRQCQAQCSCLAYVFYLGIGCMTWNMSLIDIQEFNTTAVDLFVRLAHSELAGRSEWKTILIALVITGTIAFAVVLFFVWRRQTNWQCGKGAKRENIRSYGNISELNVGDDLFKDLPLFTLQKLAVATNNFHLSNKLGQGGFGPVFKGKLDGQDIAVKRLSRASGQGLQEFMNEVLLISKLQHRNLVRLLGCCVEGEEKLLVYEFMPNKSLDALLFDPLHQELLDWKTRFKIVEGICRGLLYLHRDSRLRIIHRDLKASNILLDEDFNPKISDFGMARIFGGKEDQGNTSRVVGTYGYMPPEYAMEGRFSEKSDVYSFGVLLLEIISGRRNNILINEEYDSSSLLGYAWRLWNKDDVLSLIDPIVGNPSFQEEILKCIQLGLLCVQEFPEDRPTISEVISMLDSETYDLPRPTQPGFTQRRSWIPCQVSSHDIPNCSVNNVSLTFVSGR